MVNGLLSSGPCSIGVRPGRRMPLCVTLEDFNAQATSGHVQPRPSTSAHLARSKRNAAQLPVLLRRHRTRSRFLSSCSAFTRDAALRELRSHRTLHRRRRIARFVARAFALPVPPIGGRGKISRRISRRINPMRGPIHEVSWLRRGIHKIGCLDCGSSSDHRWAGCESRRGFSLSSGITHHSFAPYWGRGKVPCLALRAP